MLHIAIPLLVCVFGLVAHLAAPKLSALGLHAFWVGLLVTLYLYGARVVDLP